MAHLLSCRLLDEACTADDQATVTERAMACARKWENCVKDTKEEEPRLNNIYSKQGMQHGEHNDGLRSDARERPICGMQKTQPCLSTRNEEFGRCQQDSRLLLTVQKTTIMVVD